MGGQPAQENVVVQIPVAGIGRRRPGEAVVGDRQVVFLGLAPDRLEARVIRRQPLGEQRHHSNCPPGLSPFADLAHRLIDAPGRGDDRSFETFGIRGAELRHVPMIGTDHRDLDRRIIDADQAEPRGRDQEVDVGAFVVHVQDAVLCLVVLGARSRSLAAHPLGVPPGERLARRRLAKYSPVIFDPGAIVVRAARSRPWRDTAPVPAAARENRDRRTCRAPRRKDLCECRYRRRGSHPSSALSYARFSPGPPDRTGQLPFMAMKTVGRSPRFVDAARFPSASCPMDYRNSP